MRILHAIPGLTDRSGGPTTALVGLACAQAAAGAKVTVLACTREGDVITAADRLAAAGVALHTVGPCRGPLMRHPRLTDTTRTLVAAHDVVHAHGVWEELQYQVAQACLAERIPFVIRCCGLLDEWSLRRKWLKKAVYRLWRLDRMLADADAIHCTTAAEAVSTGTLRCPTPIVVEPNGIALEDFASLPERGGFRRSLAIGDAPLIVFLGRIHPGKGVEYLIPALAQMRTPGATLAVVGSDSAGYRDEMDRLADTLGVRDRIAFVGPLTGRRKIEALVDADVFCLPSQHENFGISIVEAMAAGRAVVVSEHVGVKEEILAAGAGSVTSLEPARIAAALDDWLGDVRARE
ncbi:MAG: glycosyltransferase, partial [Planctomycetia bacterium]|nr:glycosyltransferase [Planctomycetia bacterium]